MRKNKKEHNYNNNLNLRNLRENKLRFMRFLLLSNNGSGIKKTARRVMFFNYVPKKQPVCRLSGRSRGLNKYFLLSRIALRNLIYGGCITGFRKSSW